MSIKIAFSGAAVSALLLTASPALAGDSLSRQQVGAQLQDNAHGGRKLIESQTFEKVTAVKGTQDGTVSYYRIAGSYDYKYNDGLHQHGKFQPSYCLPAQNGVGVISSSNTDVTGNIECGDGTPPSADVPVNPPDVEGKICASTINLASSKAEWTGTATSTCGNEKKTQTLAGTDPSTGFVNAVTTSSSMTLDTQAANDFGLTFPTDPKSAARASSALKANGPRG